jgi:peptide/nickel transport system permease protein
MTGRHAAPPRRLSRTSPAGSAAGGPADGAATRRPAADGLARRSGGQRVAAHANDLAGPARADDLDRPVRAVRLPKGVGRFSPTAIAGGLMIVLLAVFCFVGPVFYHPDLSQVNLLVGNHPPGSAHLLGTDGNGIDVLGRLMTSGQLSLEVGVAAGLLAAFIGSIWGAVAGYLGGFADAVMMRVVDAAIAIPTIVLLLLLSAIYTPSPALLIVVIAATSWLSTAHLVRGAALTLRTRDYVQAVRAMGGGGARAIFRHVAPNAIGVILVNVTFQIADAILVLATLSYLGLGVQPPSSDWGDMIAQGIKYIYDGYWWEIYPAGIAIILAVVAFNLLGDGLRDSLGQGRRR